MFNAPRELVWTAWTDAGQVVKWYGPRGFTTTTETMDVRPGGEWRYTMHGPDGTIYPNLIKYIEIARPERLVYDHGGGEGDLEDAAFRATITFEEHGGGRTKVTMRSVFPTKEARDLVVEKYGAIEGGNQTLDRLGEHLATAASLQPLVITRMFNAPRELVWKCLTEPEHMKWFGPKGSKTISAEMDLRVGGTYHYAMQYGDAPPMWGLIVYREIMPPERLVYVQSFSDEHRAITRHPMSPTWPAHMLTTITLMRQFGKTIVTLEWMPVDPTAEERATFDGARDGMNMGWKGSFDQLEEYLATQTK
jgi:uncharacterized protein YndB with AHSA1/START domain